MSQSRARDFPSALCATWIAALIFGACTTEHEKVAQAAPTPAEAKSSEVRRVFPLRYARAQEIADTCMELLEVSTHMPDRWNGFCILMTPESWAEHSHPPLGEWTRSAQTQVVADPDSNSVIATVPVEDVDDLDRIAELVARLDVDVIEGH
jgi:hypothetical protein